MAQAHEVKMKDLGPIHVSPTGTVTAWGGRQFDSMAAAEKYAAMLELAAGRELHWRDLESPHGIHQHAFDALGEGVKQRDRTWTPPVIVPDKASENLYDRPDVQQLAKRQKFRSAREEIYAQGRAEWEASQDQAVLDRIDREKRAPVAKAARDLADQLRVSSDSSLDEVREALRMVQAAETPNVDLDWVKAEYVRLSEQQAARRKTQRDAIKAQLERFNQLLGEPAPLPQKHELGLAYWFSIGEYDPRREEKLRDNATYEAVYGGPPSPDNVARALGQ
jgi:hypothetical protein